MRIQTRTKRREASAGEASADESRPTPGGETMNTRRIAAATAGLILAGVAGLGCGTAEASPVKGRVDICAVEVSKTWTKGLSKKANRAFHQRVKVYRVTEWTLADQPCDLFLWPTENRNRAGVSDLEGSFEQVAKATNKKDRPASVVRALRVIGIR